MGSLLTKRIIFITFFSCSEKNLYLLLFLSLCGKSHATPPTGSRPDHRLIFNCNTHESNVRVDVFPNGDVQYIAGTRINNWISLGGISFVLHTHTDTDTDRHTHTHGNAFRTCPIASPNCRDPGGCKDVVPTEHEV